MPAVVTLIVGVMAPVDQVLPVAELEARITEPPWQNVIGPEAVMEAVVKGITETLCVADAIAQPLETVKVYTPAVFTRIVGVAAPVDQLLPVVKLEDRMTEPPGQKFVGPPGVMAAVIVDGITVTAILEEAVPHTVDTLSEYVPDVVMVTDGADEPFDHVFPVAVAEVSTTVFPWQKVVGPLAVIAALAAGSALTV